MRILVLSDTHARRPQDVSSQIVSAAGEADLVVHCGDFVALDVVEVLRHAARRLVAVHGNLDPEAVRRELPAKESLELDGKKIAVSHPAYGGPPWGLEEKLLNEFPDADIILFGHLHKPVNAERNGVLLFNPGRGYSSPGLPGTYGILELEKGKVETEIVSFGGGA